MNISYWIERHADYAPSKIAVGFEGRDLSYRDLAREITRLAAGLAQELGVRRGDRVAILSYNRPEFLAVVFACARIGAICVPLNWRLAPPEQLYILRHADISALFAMKPLARASTEFAPICRRSGWSASASRAMRGAVTRVALRMAPPSRRARSMIRR